MKISYLQQIIQEEAEKLLTEEHVYGGRGDTSQLDPESLIYDLYLKHGRMPHFVGTAPDEPLPILPIRPEEELYYASLGDEDTVEDVVNKQAMAAANVHEHPGTVWNPYTQDWSALADAEPPTIVRESRTRLQQIIQEETQKLLYEQGGGLAGRASDAFAGMDSAMADYDTPAASSVPVSSTPDTSQFAAPKAAAPAAAPAAKAPAAKAPAAAAPAARAPAARVPAAVSRYKRTGSVARAPAAAPAAPKAAAPKAAAPKAAAPKAAAPKAAAPAAAPAAAAPAAAPAAAAPKAAAPKAAAPKAAAPKAAAPAAAPKAAAKKPYVSPADAAQAKYGSKPTEAAKPAKTATPEQKPSGIKRRLDRKTAQAFGSKPPGSKPKRGDFDRTERKDLGGGRTVTTRTSQKTGPEKPLKYTDDEKAQLQKDVASGKSFALSKARIRRNRRKKNK